MGILARNGLRELLFKICIMLLFRSETLTRRCSIKENVPRNSDCRLVNLQEKDSIAAIFLGILRAFKSRHTLENLRMNASIQ